MHKSVQILIAAACIVNIAAGSIWLMDRKKQADAETAKAEAMFTAIERKNEARRKAEADSCRVDLEAYDNGSIIAFVQRAKGGDMLAEVNKCREMISR